MTIGQHLQPSLALFDRRSCPQCAAPMVLVEREPGAPGSEFRAYECRNCKFTQQSVVRC